MMNNRTTQSTSFLGALLIAIPVSQAFITSLASPAFSNFQSGVSECSNFLATSSSTSISTPLYATIVSPFDSVDEDTATADVIEEEALDDGPLDLTWDNVELVLDTMRDYLIQDGGNVAIKEIDGPIVRLELQGACGTCPSSTQTLKMGLERGLRERIPEIQEVIQAMPEGPALEVEQVDVVLDGVRPFLQVAGGEINCVSISGEGSVRPIILLKMEGASASLKSVKLEIQQRLQRHFMLAGLVVEWDE